MADRPIIFSSAMVRAILEGRKTQTRRVVKPPPECGAIIRSGDHWVTQNEPGLQPTLGVRLRCPYGAPGDTLWVRETWAVAGNDDGHPCDAKRRPCRLDQAERFYRADTTPTAYGLDRLPGERGDFEGPWRSPIHMPRWASRLTLRVTDVRVERLQEISEEDARAEGVAPFEDSHYMQFAHAWDCINGKRAPWSSNPYVWALSFERVKEAARG